MRRNYSHAPMVIRHQLQITTCHRLILSPDQRALVVEDALADGAVDGGFDGVSAGVGDSGEAEVAGEVVDDVFSLMG